MAKIRKWFRRGGWREVWSEPELPPYVKINPNSPPGSAMGLQPGDLSMALAAEKFLEADPEDPEAEDPEAENWRP